MLIDGQEIEIHDLVRDKATGRVGGVTGFSKALAGDTDHPEDEICIAYQNTEAGRVEQHWFAARDAERA